MSDVEASLLQSETLRLRDQLWQAHAGALAAGVIGGVGIIAALDHPASALGWVGAVVLAVILGCLVAAGGALVAVGAASVRRDLGTRRGGRTG